MLKEKYWEAAPDGIKAMRNLHQYLAHGPLGAALLELVYLRISQINGCAFCCDMHAEAARAAGVSQRKLDVVAAWHEAPALFDEREKAALACAEALNRLGPDCLPDALYDKARAQFSSREMVDVVIAAGMIEMWNRIALTFHPELPERQAPKPVQTLRAS